LIDRAFRPRLKRDSAESTVCTQARRPDLSFSPADPPRRDPVPFRPALW
jgi:hypothetical protein